MLFRIDVFPPSAKGGNGSSDGSTRPSQTLYCSPSTVANRLKGGNIDGGSNGKNNSDVVSNGGLVVKIGRKGDVDVLFGTDRSISREHAVLRLVGLPTNQKPNTGAGKSRTSPRRSRRRTDSTASVNDNNETVEQGGENSGWCVEPRNEHEAVACRNSPFKMCLVLENKGKSGSYVASEDTSIDLDNENQNDNGDNAGGDGHDSDATTDGEDGGIGTYQNSQQQASHYGLATSVATQTGEILASRNTMLHSTNPSSPQGLPSLSAAIQHHFGSGTPIKLTKLDPGESQVLSFDGSEAVATKSKINSNRPHDDKAHRRDRSVLVQFGIAQLPTIQVTHIPMTAVFSSGIQASIKDSFRLCGGLVQETGTLPRRHSHEQTTTTTGNTTHLITNSRAAVAKQLIAWCYEIPIVSPEFVMALGSHASLKDPFPVPGDFPPVATDTSSFWESKPSQGLLSGYVVLSTDPCPEAEALVEASGAKLEIIYDEQKRQKHTKASVAAFLEHAEGLLKGNRAVVLLAPMSKSKLSNANTVLLVKTLREDLGIPTVTAKMLAKTISKQESSIVGLQPPVGNHEKASRPSLKETSSRPSLTCDTTETRRRELESQTHHRGSQKRAWEESSTAGDLSSLYPDRHEESGFDLNSNGINEETTPERSSSQSQKKRRMEQAMQPPLAEATKTITADTASESSPTQLGGADANGWFRPAPRDDHERSRWKKRASEAYRIKTGAGLERSASTDIELLSVPAANPGVTAVNRARNLTGTNNNHRYYHHRRPTRENLPDFKAFRKNRVVPSVEVVLLAEALSASKKEQLEMSAEEHQLDEEQRLAEALFRGEAVPGGQRRRRGRS